jgi:lipopolysaccharide export system protein LptA
MHFFLSSTRTFLQVVILSFAFLLGTSTGFCQGSDDPINIEADRMVSQEEENSVVFMGNVDASQGKVTIRTDKMTIYYTSNDSGKSKSQAQQVKKMICIGKVKVTQEDWLGTGDRMEYFADARKVVLQGHAKAWQGKNMVSGKTITYYLDEKRSEVGSPDAKIANGGKKKQERVRATIIPNSNKKK